MNIKLVTFLLVWLETAYLKNSYPLNVLESNLNCFHNIDFNVFDVTNTLLASLRIHQDFTKDDHTQRLLSMLQLHMTELVTRNCNSFKDLERTTFEIYNKTDANNLKKVLQELITEEFDHVKNVELDETGNNIKIAPTIEDKNDNFEDTGAEEILKDFKENWSLLTENTMGNLIASVLSENEIPEPYVSSEESNIYFDARRSFKSMRNQINNYPFLASIHIMSAFLCSGSIVSKDMVITAASCLQIVFNKTIDRDNPRSLFVRVGSDYSKHAGDLIPIVHVIFHPQYDSLTLNHNIVIVRVLEPFTHTKENNIMRIKYDTIAKPITDDMNEMTILGWGSKYSHKPKNTKFLKMADLYIYDNIDCQEVYSRYYVTKTNFCAGLALQAGGVCVGDVGDAAVSAEELVGIISFGPSDCGLENAPTVFTKIGYYADWIDHVISQKSPLREGYTQTTSYRPPNFHIVPVFTTPRQRETGMNSGVHVASSVYPEEMEILKEVINEFITSNATVMDYILNDGDDTATKSQELIENLTYFDPNRPENIIMKSDNIENDESFDTDTSELEVMAKRPFKSNILGTADLSAEISVSRVVGVTISD